MQKTIKHAYFCDGKPECYGNANCRLVHYTGSCDHTTDISYALHRKLIIQDEEYCEKHMVKVADSDWEELYFEE